MHVQSLTPFFTVTQEQHDTQPAQHDTMVSETQQPTSTTTKVRAKTSLVWNHFVEKLLKVEGRQNVSTAINYLIIKKDMVQVFLVNTMK